MKLTYRSCFRSISMLTVPKNNNVVFCYSSETSVNGVTLPMFVRYVLWLRSHSKAYSDWNWKPQNEKCRPCFVKYDAIIYFETMNEDAKVVLHEIGAGPKVTLPPRSVDTRLPKSKKYMTLYDNVPITDIQQLLSYYKKDYEIYGYEIPSKLRQRLGAAGLNL